MLPGAEAGLASGNGGGTVTISAGSAPGPVIVPEHVFLLDAAFDRHGPDLHLSDPAGRVTIVKGYFTGGGTPADLTTESGAIVTGQTAKILAGSPALMQVAQIGSAAGPAAIGKVTAMTGEVIVGAYGADSNGSGSGSSYVLFGGDFTASVTHLGDSGADALTGTAADERFVGGQGDDVLTGNGGADVFEGGAGNDLIRVADLVFQRADGGGNDDRVLFDLGVSSTIDLSGISKRILGIEQLDFANGVDDTLDVEAGDILDLRVRNVDVSGVPGLDNTVAILGEATDEVNLLGGWTLDAGLSGGGFDVYAYDAAPDLKVAVQDTVTVLTP